MDLLMLLSLLSGCETSLPGYNCLCVLVMWKAVHCRTGVRRW